MPCSLVKATARPANGDRYQSTEDIGRAGKNEGHRGVQAEVFDDSW